MKPMDLAPTDGSMIEVFAKGKWWQVRYQDCQWLREDDETGKGDPEIADAWQVQGEVGKEDIGHIELDEADGWRKLIEH